MDETKRWGKMKCSQCQKDKPTNPKAREARLKRFGSEEEMLAKWVCSKCKKNTAGTQPEPVPEVAEEKPEVPEPEIVPEEF